MPFTFFMLLAVASRAMAAGNECGELKGNGVRVEGSIPGKVQEGAFRLVDGAPVALFDHHGQRVFGSLSIVPFRQGYEAVWTPISGAPGYLLVLNGTGRASLMSRRDAHWTIPYPPGTVVGPLTITCSGFSGKPAR
jgi:hypothetical protein